MKLLSLQFLISGRGTRGLISRARVPGPTGMKLRSAEYYLFDMDHRWRCLGPVSILQDPQFLLQGLCRDPSPWLLPVFMTHITGSLACFLSTWQRSQAKSTRVKYFQESCFLKTVKSSSFFSLPCPHTLSSTRWRPQVVCTGSLLLKNVVSMSFTMNKTLRIVAVVRITQNKKGQTNANSLNLTYPIFFR